MCSIKERSLFGKNEHEQAHLVLFTPPLPRSMALLSWLIKEKRFSRELNTFWSLAAFP